MLLHNEVINNFTKISNLVFKKKVTKKGFGGSYGSLGRQMIPQPQRRKHQQASPGSEKTIKQLLGELYGDRQYLEKLLKETSKNKLIKVILFLISLSC